MDIPKQKKAVIYCRVSTKEQVEEGNSLATQERNCTEYAIKHGYEIAAIFREEGESAKTADRTELKKLMAFCSSKKNSISVVIAYKIDRISRNTDDYSQIRILLKRYGVEIKSTSEHFEDTPAGRFMENIIANVAQFDNDVRAERSIGGMREAVREGRYVWKAPYGYSNVRVNGKTTIAQNEFAPYVRKAFEEVAKQQYPITEIRSRLIAEGLVTVLGKPLSLSQFYAMLKNRLYTGWIHQFGERQRGLFTPIIEEGLFNVVQQVVEGKKSSYLLPKKDNSDFPLRRFFKHPSGRMMTGCWSKGKYKKYPYYMIHTHRINIRKELLESVFQGWLNHFKLDIDYFESLHKKVKEYTVGGIDVIRKGNEEIHKQMVMLKAKQEQLIEKNIAGIISNELAKEYLSKIEQELFSLQQQTKSIPVNAIDFSRLLELTRSVLLQPGDVWAKSDIQVKIALQKFYFPHGIEFDGKESRTHKICNIFKLNGKIPSHLSYNVHHSKSKSNTDNWQILHIVEEHNKGEPVSIEEIQEELLKLSTILTPLEHTVYLMQRA